MQFIDINYGLHDTVINNIDENGELLEWPKGFFDQKSQDLRDLFQIRRENASH